MTKCKTITVVVAHADDELLYYGGTILRNPSIEWHIICVTDSGDSGISKKRGQEFKFSCEKLGVARSICLGFYDNYTTSLNILDLVDVLRNVVAEGEVYTHSFYDRHHHHREVLTACCLAFGRERVKAYYPNSLLPPDLLSKKRKILLECYHSQVYYEELFSRYQWNQEGVTSPILSLCRMIPISCELELPVKWELLLSLGLVQYGTQTLLSLSVESLISQLNDKGIGSFVLNHAASGVGDYCLSVAAEKNSNKLEWAQAFQAIADSLDAQGLLLSFRHGAGRSIWTKHKNGLRMLLGPNLFNLRELQWVAVSARELGCNEIVLPPETDLNNTLLLELTYEPYLNS